MIAQKTTAQPKPIVYAFIDSQNLNLGTQRVGWKLDWRRFRRLLNDKYNVSKAYMFIGYMSENEQLYEYMHELGFLVVLKPTLNVKSTETNKKDDAPKDNEDKEKPTVKGNVDAELVLYAMKEQPNYDKAIIVSGDGDFFSLIEYLDGKNMLDHIMAPNWQYSTLLKQYESKIIRLDKLKRQLAYHDRRDSKRPKEA
jgi:uncharacterized LabA/DUF88 family protein